MRSVTEYIAKADEFDELAKNAPDSTLRRRYADVAECYRLLAAERQRLIAEGTISSDQER